MKEKEVDFNEINEEDVDESSGTTSLSAEDFLRGNFIKNPPVGESITLEIKDVVSNKNTKGKNSITGKDFDIGVKDKLGRVKRIDILTKDGAYTISSWGVYFQLFGKDGLLMKYFKEHNTFAGAKVKLTHLFDGQHATLRVEDLAKIFGRSVEDTRRYQEEIKLAMKENRLYKTEMV